MKCWYCSIRDSEEKYAYKLDMYGGVAASSEETQTNIAYNVRHVEIPRCIDCHKKHRIAKIFKILSVLLAVLMLAAFAAFLFDLAEPKLSGVCLGLTIGLVIASLLAGHFVSYRIKTIRKGRAGYPEVEDLLKQCYRFGVRPKERIPVSEAPCEESENSSGK